MKFIALTLVILLSLALKIQATSPQTNILYNISFPDSGVQYYSNGLYYFSYSIYNSTSGEVYPLTVPKNCSIYPQFSPQVIPWCYGSISNADGTFTFQVHYLNSLLNQSIATADIGTFPSYTFVSYEYTNGYLVLIITGYQSAQYNYTLVIYDLENLEAVCPKASIDQMKGASTIYTDGNIFLSGYLTDSHNAVFTVMNCSTGQNYTSTGVNEYQEVDLYGFNNSAVFINFYEYQKNLQNTYYIEPAAFDSFHKLRFGSSINVTSFLPYNDTHFFMSYYPNGKFTFGLFIITPELQILEVLSFNLGVPGVGVAAYPVYGTSWISVDLGTTYLTYDLNARAIIAVNSIIPPIILANGSVVNMTQFGYFIQNPGSSFYFIESPFSNPTAGIYQNPSDFNQYYTLFVPSASYNYYSKCVMTHVNATSSKITQSFFPNCPLSLQNGNPINIKDVQFDSNGNPHVAYRDQYGSVYVINPAGSNGPFKSTYLYTSVQMSLNLTNGTLNYVGTQLTSFIMGRISYTTGTVYQTFTYPTGSYYTTVFKINPQYVMVSYTETNTKFDLWDIVNFVKISSVTSNLQMNLYTTTPGYVFGFNPSSPANYTGVIFWTAGYIYLMNSGGETYVLNPGQVISVYDVVPISQNLFFAAQYQSNLQGEVLYQISNWGTNATEKANDREIEIEY